MHDKLDIRVYPIDEPKGNTVAFASVAVDDLVAIRGIRVVEGEKGLFVSMPQSFDKNTEEYHDIAFPMYKELRDDIKHGVLDEYEEKAALAPEERGYEKPEKNTAGDLDVSGIKLDVRVYPLKEPQGNTKAFAGVAIDEMITIRGIRVVEGEKGLFVTMPQSHDKKTNEYHDIAFPIVGDLRKEIKNQVLAKYEAKEKSADKSLANGLKRGADKAADAPATDKKAAAKKSPGLGD